MWISRATWQRASRSNNHTTRLNRKMLRAWAWIWVWFLGGLLACGSEPVEVPDVEPEAIVVAEPIGSSNANPGIVEQFRLDRIAVRHESDGGGFAYWASGPPDAVVGQSLRLEILYEAGPLGIATGGAVYLQIPPFWGWSPVQTELADAPGYATAETDVKGVRLEVEAADANLLAVFVQDLPLTEGEQIKIVYGAGPAEARADRFAERDAPIHLATDGDGDGVRKTLAVPLRLDVAAGVATQLVAHAPSVVRPGEPIPLRVCALDRDGNAGVDQRGPFRTWIRGTRESIHGGILGEDGCGSVAVRTQGTGLLVLEVAGPAGLETFSNPVWVDDVAPNLLWADLHGHSHVSDGTGTPDDYFRYARDVAGLDAAALTDHDHWGMPFLDESEEIWAGIQQSVQRFHEPGVFVSLLGYEWTSWIYGHRHVLYFQDEGEIHSSAEEATDHPTELWDALRGQAAMTFAHHSAGAPVATDWRIPPDAELEPLVEIASVHGSSESNDTPGRVQGAQEGNFVRDALGRGYPLGFVASGDSHDGHPGLTHLASGRGGVAAILSQTKTREGLLSALRARRTYATNGPRILLHATLDGFPVGADVPAASEHRLKIKVASTTQLQAIEVVQDGEVVASLLEEASEAVSLETILPGSADTTSYLYLRVRQEGGGAAWTSPFFLRPAKP